MSFSVAKMCQKDDADRVCCTAKVLIANYYPSIVIKNIVKWFQQICASAS
ncbi:hypothetical protein [Mesorhizobium sp.]|nr:hypothetical protein [Mesorhizobium sp.]